MSDRNEEPAANPEEEPRELEEALLRGLRERDLLLREAAEAAPDAARTARNLAAFRAIASDASKTGRPPARSPMQPPVAGSGSPWKLLLGAAAAVLVVLVAKWIADDPNASPSSKGTPGHSMGVLGDPSGIHLDGAVLRWPALDPRSEYRIQIVDPSGVVEAAVIEVLENHAPLPERFRDVPRLRVTVTTTRESGETRSSTESLDRSP